METKIKNPHIFSTNTVSAQIIVEGLRTYTGNKITCYYNDSICTTIVNYVSSSTYSQDYNWNDFQVIEQIPAGVRPKQFIYSGISSSGMRIRVGTNGKWQYQAIANTANPYIQFSITYHYNK